ncbi:MAG: DEAD/DEAH box helicase, partial [Verrucomicrobia bacterium]|nr:DEAD/DEAH box helicase [Verrucomicrobiota bacterium]
MTPKLFSELGLSPELLKAIEKMGFEQASPIQAAAIPVLLTGKDIVGQSMTGSGKTAAFGVPAVEKVDATKREVQVLILCPTRELAVQVSEEIHKLSFFKRGVAALPIYGGQSYDRQLYGLKQGAQIVIGTPGRVMDHMRRGTLRLGGVKMVILDEADVMLNMGFREDIELILADTPKERQTVFFSATMPRGLEFLVATDIAARGIDVDDVQVVFNYDLPYDPEDYVHRIGRTGRAGRSGRAISLVPGRELFQIRNIERFTNMRIQRGRIPTADEVVEARENVFIEKLRALLTGGEYQKHDQVVERLLEEGFSSTDIASALIHLLQSGEAA